MALTDLGNILKYRFFVLIVIIHGTSSSKTILLEESRVCKLKASDADPSIILGKEKASSVIVTQKTYFAGWTGRYNFICSFSVSAPKNYGLYAVIQELNFRRDEKTDQCKDYVSFSVPQMLFERFFEKRKEKKICGRVHASQTHQEYLRALNSGNVENTVAHNAFVAPRGEILVTIYIAPERLLRDEKLNVKIAFTAYKEALNRGPNNIQCRSGEWIWAGLVKNEIQNCPYVTCMDESNCQYLSSPFEYHDIVISNEIGTKVTVLAVSAIMITFFVFAVCLLACRRSQRCCWQTPQRNNSVRVEMNQTRQVPGNATESLAAFGDQHVTMDPMMSPSAPPLNDKDVPPSYESLFPSK